MDILLGNVKGHLGSIPDFLRTFPDFKKSILESEDIDLEEEQVSKILQRFKKEFLLPLGKIIDDALVATESAFAKLRPENFDERIDSLVQSRLDEQRVVFDEQSRKMQETIRNLEQQLNADAAEKTVESPKKKKKSKRFGKKRKPKKNAEDGGGSPVNDVIDLPPPGEGDFSVGDLVCTPIVFGSAGKDKVWVDASIQAVNGGGDNFDLKVLDPARYKVNPSAVHVPRDLIRMKGRVAAPKEPGCYVKFHPETDTLFQIWSESPVEGAVMFFKPKKKVAKFKYKKGGKSELARSFGSVGNSYYEAFVSFAKEAFAYKADILIFQDQWGPLSPVKFVLWTEKRLTTTEEGAYYDLDAVEAIAAVHSANTKFSGLSAIPKKTFITNAHREGASSAL